MRDLCLSVSVFSHTHTHTHVNRFYNDRWLKTHRKTKGIRMSEHGRLRSSSTYTHSLISSLPPSPIKHIKCLGIVVFDDFSFFGMNRHKSYYTETGKEMRND